MALSSTPAVGLDVGTSAIRAAQVSSGRGGFSLTAFGQVPLPVGALQDGEIADAGAVSAAIARLWKRSKIRSKRVVIGLANQRVVVRQVDLPFLDEKDLRASIRFQVADHIPMPIDEAELDYRVLRDYEDTDGDHMMTVLLVAAASDMVSSFVDAVQTAGLEVVGVDLAPFAVARAVSRAARQEEGHVGAEAIIDVGAGTTNIIVHAGGEPRFVRILLSGGNAITEVLADEMSVSFEEAEALKIDISGGASIPEAERIVDREVDAFVTELRNSIDYYVAREGGEPISSFTLTGGGSLVRDLRSKVAAALGAEVLPAAAFSDVDVKTKWDDAQMAQIEPVIAASLGLAMGRRP
ncbi:MAG: type IV pilus assembly protein PilM [Actinomycetota bacterium]